MEIFLIRHAQSKGNENGIVQGHQDNGLSDLGKIQAEKLSEYLKDKNITSIYSSDLSRAIETATPTSKKLNLTINYDPNLREANFGIWEGMTYEKVKDRFPSEYNAWHKNYHIRPHWFESYKSHFTRIKKAIEKVLKVQKPNSKIAIFTHGGSIKTQLGFYGKHTGEELTKFSTLNCSITLVQFNSAMQHEKGSLIYYNKDVIN